MTSAGSKYSLCGFFKLMMPPIPGTSSGGYCEEVSSVNSLPWDGICDGGAVVLFLDPRDVSVERRPTDVELHTLRATLIEKSFQGSLAVCILNPRKLWIAAVHPTNFATTDDRERHLDVTGGHRQVVLHVVARTRPLLTSTLLVRVSHVHLSHAMEVPGNHFKKTLCALALIYLRNPRMERRATNEVLDMLSA
eukprot:CAMPEP_0115274420 /NCGR_PEP_ID=MMETSP0270-20121206/55665_1 /TAXON_ID=71861 /ORGANISM="Scrippsiella trochoidea, Strain CCMP3099" /LENGTH=192 /DNA_ID=CAMNT_0002690929 /DNA_START=89 /DNA_END=666 /DNA_ORIENTATION=-